MNTLEIQLKFYKGEAVSYSSSNQLWPRRESAPIKKLGMNSNTLEEHLLNLEGSSTNPVQHIVANRAWNKKMGMFQ